VVELTIILAAARGNSNTVLRDAATLYKVDTDAITLKVKQEVVANERARKEPKPTAKTTAKVRNAA
jgi:ParB family transcriptional regulator, chromosome partitioning protein